ncbi:cytochrome ubiquinol oxidase subunit I [Streptomyces sp. NPDC048720]|uniref:cytochrome ubiquinol oxidase subunit I n=1 Tax=Streptomyces sp. NPDC048720 TaxID=3365588 RepID=UPI00372317EE
MVLPALLTAADPPQLLPAREQMAFTLGFHIILVPFGLAFTFMMLVCHYRALRRGDQQALVLAQRWSKVAAVLFAVGAVSGTVLTFELGLLWPGLMGKYGPAFGFPFAVEGLFFFLEAIFVAIYIHGWKRLPPWPHFFTGVVVTLAGVGGTASVIAANSWMNQPAGIAVRNGRVVGVIPSQVFFNGAFWWEMVHMLLAAYIVAGFMVAGVYAWGLLKGRRDHYQRLGFAVPFTVAAIAMPLQFLVGDTIARQVYEREPAKFSAVELLPTTGDHVPETLGGIFVDGKVRYGIQLPDVASVLAGFTPSTTIRRFNAIPAAVRPTDSVVSIADSPRLFHQLSTVGAPLLVVSGLCGLAALLLLRRGSPPVVRTLAAIAITTVVGGWGVAQYPYLLGTHLTIQQAAAPTATLWVLIAVSFVAVILIVPSLLLLYSLQLRRKLG